MDKSQRAKHEVAKNSKADLGQVEDALRTVSDLRRRGVAQRGYQLASPHSRRLLHAAPESDEACAR